MRRFPGHEILVLGFSKHILLVAYQNSKLVRIRRIDNVHSDFCVDLAIKGNKIFSKGIHEKEIKIITFEPPAKIPHENLSLATSLPYQPSPTKIPEIPPKPLKESQAQPSIPWVKPILPSSIDLDYLNRRPPPLPMKPVVTIYNPPSPQKELPRAMRPPPPAFNPVKYNEFNAAELIFDVSGQLEKLAISRTGTLVYAGGGTGCNLLKYDETTQKYMQVKNEFLPKLSFFGIKSTKSGHLMVQEPTTNDLIILKSSGLEVTRYAAPVKFTFPVTHIRNPHFSGETDKVIWFSGTNEIAVVDLRDLKIKDYKTFLPSNGSNKDSIALRAIMKDDAKTILISFVLDSIFGLAYLHRGLIEPNIYLLSDILPSFKGLYAMDVGAEGSTLVFMVGQSHPVGPASGGSLHGVIACLSLEKDLILQAEHKFTNRNYTGATAIRRLKASSNELVMGVFKSIVILEYSERSFKELMIFENVHSDIVDDIAVFGNHILSVSRKDRFINHISILNF